MSNRLPDQLQWHTLLLPGQHSPRLQTLARQEKTQHLVSNLNTTHSRYPLTYLKVSSTSSSGIFWLGPTAGPSKKSTPELNLCGIGPTLDSSKAFSCSCFGVLLSNPSKTFCIIFCRRKQMTFPSCVSFFSSGTYIFYLLLLRCTDGCWKRAFLVSCVAKRVFRRPCLLALIPRIGREVGFLLL